VADGFDAAFILWLNLLGTFVFGLSGGLAAVRARLDVFGVVVLAGVVGLAGGIVRDLLFGWGLGPVQAVILGAITGIGGGMLRDVLLGEVPIVLRQELYAIPALAGAAVVAVAHVAGGTSPVFAVIGAVLCFVMRLTGLRYGLDVPVPAGDRRRGAPPD
jgi:uncharacterized membrane protein YeiH